MRVVSVVQGADGGIGRFEILLELAWAHLARRGTVQARTLTVSHRPPVFEPPAAPDVWTAGGNRARLVAALIRSWWAWRPDLVIFGHVNLARLGPLLKAVRPRTPYVTIAHGTDVWPPLSALKRLALRQSERVWCVSDFTRRTVLAGAPVEANRVRTLPLALADYQLERLAAAGAPVPATTHPVLLSVCRMHPRERLKGIDHVLAALPRVAEAVPDVAYVVVGGGGDVPRLQALAERLGIGARVTFTGPLPDPAVAEAYHRAAVFVLPSASEGFGLVFLEAMACARPIVAATAGATPEIVVSGETGLLVPYADVGALATALSELLLDGPRRERLGWAGRARLHERFVFRRFVARLAELLADLHPAPAGTAPPGSRG